MINPKKRFRKLLSMLLAAVAVLSLTVSCAKPEQTPVESTTTAVTEAATTTTTTTAAPSGEIRLTDMMDREIRLAEPATRVVALTPADCEILYAIGAGDTLVGRGEYCDYPVEVADVPAVQSGNETNIEQIIALKPQVLLMGTMAQTEEQVEALEKAGVTVVVSDAQDIEGVYEAIRMLGALMGKDPAAEALIDDMKATFDEVSQDKVGSKKTVYFEVSPLEFGLWTAGDNTFMNEAAEMVGLENVFSDVDGWGEVSEEQVLERNPDYIVTISMYFGEGPTPVEEILGRSGWENLTAVKNKAILNLQDNELSRPGPRIAEGTRLLSDFVRENDLPGK
jgi:iron complex transport system substrate-binding protein